MSRTAALLAALDALPQGYGAGTLGSRRYGVTLRASPDGRRRWLYAEELGGPDRISANLYRLADGRTVLKPCEMPAEKVADFVLAYRPDAVPAEGTSVRAGSFAKQRNPASCKE